MDINRQGGRREGLWAICRVCMKEGEGEERTYMDISRKGWNEYGHKGAHHSRVASMKQAAKNSPGVMRKVMTPPP